MKKKHKKKRGRKWTTPTNYHHILFQGLHWQQGYAKLLREHPYMGKMVPAATLHAMIHSKIHDVPRPNRDDLKRAYKELLRRQAAGEIDIEHDTLEQRIGFLIEMWRDTCPATTAILVWQRSIVAKFYQGADLKRQRRLARQETRRKKALAGGNFS